MERISRAHSNNYTHHRHTLPVSYTYIYCIIHRTLHLIHTKFELSTLAEKKRSKLVFLGLYNIIKVFTHIKF